MKIPRLLSLLAVPAWLICVPGPLPVLGNVDLVSLTTKPDGASATLSPLVRLVSIDEVLAAVAHRRKVVFVDAREPPEAGEERIPGAVNLPLRGVARAEMAAYADAALVIPYCLKDFRGFEVAKALQNRGLANVRLLQQPGINGWKASGLPTAGAVPRRTDGEAQALLGACAQTRACLKEASR